MPTQTSNAGSTQYLAQNGYVIRAPRQSRPLLLIGALLLFGMAAGLVVAGINNTQNLFAVIVCILIALLFAALGVACIASFRNIGSYLVVIGPGGIERHVGGKVLRVDYRELTDVRCSLIVSVPPSGAGVPTPRKVRESAVIRIALAPRQHFGEEFEFMRTNDEPAPYAYKIKVLAPASVSAARQLANEIWQALYAYAPNLCRPLDERTTMARRLT